MLSGARSGKGHYVRTWSSSPFSRILKGWQLTADVRSIRGHENFETNFFLWIIGSKQKNGIVIFIFINYSSRINTSLLFIVKFQIHHSSSWNRNDISNEVSLEVLLRLHFTLQFFDRYANDATYFKPFSFPMWQRLSSHTGPIQSGSDVL